ncbi:MAG: DUF835 domain-containing protein [Candidatus Thermoplasmatota archaeon]|jgi:hypothetical protein|nr:DUF835 domain-containing protein [Candidatus Thermoplasmatota archaeon]
MTNDKSYREGYRDGLNFAVIMAKIHGGNQKLLESLQKEMDQNSNENLVKLNYGESYLIFEKGNKNGMSIASKIATSGKPLVLITRDARNNLKSIQNVKTVLISYDETQDGLNPGELSKIQDYVLKDLENKTVVYMDCIDYFLSVSSSPQMVFKLVGLLKDRIAKMNGIFILSLNREALEKNHASLIEKEFRNIIKTKRED